jgi:hypothetical protein
MVMLHRQGHAASTWTSSFDMDMQYWHGHIALTWKCSIDMDMQYGHGHAAWTWTCSMDMDIYNVNSFEFSSQIPQLQEIKLLQAPLPQMCSAAWGWPNNVNKFVLCNA